MQLLRLAEVPTSDPGMVFSYSRVRALWFVLISLVLAGGGATLSAARGSRLGYYAAAVLLLGLLIFQKTVTARFRPSNWLLRLTDAGLFIKFRSYLNCHLAPEDYTVVFLPYAEIRAARRVDEVRQVADRDPNHRPTQRTRKLRWLELELAAESRPLAIAMANERDTVLAKTRIGNQKPSIRYHHFPVQLASPSRLRIEWAVTPKIDSILEQLARHTRVPAKETAVNDFVSLETVSRTEQEYRLLELAASGDKIAAIALARKLYGYDLAMAKDFIDGLVAKQGAQKPAL